MKHDTYKNKKKIYDIKQKWVDEFVKIPNFSERCSQLCSWVQNVYDAPRVLLFFHS